jgi:Asp-tRNA(Asn)/Glu-tRNA(Gln) amidotransferase A subunit family amidase
MLREERHVPASDQRPRRLVRIFRVPLLGLSMGLQIIAPYEADIRCLQLARAYENATD